MEKTMKGILAAFAGMAVMACSGCGGGGEDSKPAPAAVQLSGSTIVAETPIQYKDGRTAAAYRLPSQEHGIVLRHGTAPQQADAGGARDAYVYKANGIYYMTYDGAGPEAWNTVLAESADLVNWRAKGGILGRGVPGELDAFCICYGPTFNDNGTYRFFYTAATDQSPAPTSVPGGAYNILAAHAPTPEGPWVKDGPILTTKPNTYYSIAATPGTIVQWKGEYLQFFTAEHALNGKWATTVSIARAPSVMGPWKPDAASTFPLEEQIENATIHYQESTKQWFMFTNHVGDSEYTDAIWVYWTSDPENWNPKNKAIVVDGKSSSWSKHAIGIPAIMLAGDRLAVFYDGNPAPQLPTGMAAHLKRDIGLAWVGLPIRTPN